MYICNPFYDLQGFLVASLDGIPDLHFLLTNGVFHLSRAGARLLVAFWFGVSLGHLQYRRMILSTSYAICLTLCFLDHVSSYVDLTNEAIVLVLLLNILLTEHT